MASLVQRIVTQAYKTFRNLGGDSPVIFHQNIINLTNLMNTLTASDLNFDKDLVKDVSVYQPTEQRAPVDYINIWDRDDCLSIGIFVLKNGTRLPLHDHPGMHGLIRVIHGSVVMKSYSAMENYNSPLAGQAHVNSEWKDTEQQVIRVRQVLADKVLCSTSGTAVLTPDHGNFHEILAIDGPAAFFDILSPPYDHSDHGLRWCSYYKEVAPPPSESRSEDDAIRYLFRIPPPSDYWTDAAEYIGPKIDPFMFE